MACKHDGKKGHVENNKGWGSSERRKGNGGVGLDRSSPHRAWVARVEGRVEKKADQVGGAGHQGGEACHAAAGTAAERRVVERRAVVDRRDRAVGHRTLEAPWRADLQRGVNRCVGRVWKEVGG